MKAELIEEFEIRLKNETKKYEGIPVAVSGGIDSSTLAAFIKPRFIVSIDLPGGDIYHEGKYSRLISKHLNLEHLIIQLDTKQFQIGVREAVKAVGRPIPHFNIFPLWAMYKKLAEMGEKKLILGDGPDETMCGYARNLIVAYLYEIYNFPAFKPYKPMIDDIFVLESVADMYAEIIGKDKKLVGKSMAKHKNLLKAMNQADIDLMRPDMDEMTNKIAEHFGIQNIRPYQDNPEFDKWQLNLPDEAKIYEHEYGKYILRMVAEKYLPNEIAWRKIKRGGPVFPVNKFMGWDKDFGEFGKGMWMEYQRNILKQ